MCAESCKRVAFTTITLTNDGMVQIQCECGSRTHHATAIEGAVLSSYDERSSQHQYKDNRPLSLDALLKVHSSNR
jgi:hypothetical protein